MVTAGLYTYVKTCQILHLFIITLFPVCQLYHNKDFFKKDAVFISHCPAIKVVIAMKKT